VSRYTKALDHIKSLRKEKALQLKVQDNELEHLKSNFAKSGRVREHKRTIEQQVSQTELRIAELDGGEIEKLVEQMTSLMDQHREFQGLQAQVESSELEKSHIQKNIETIKENLELYNGIFYR
jgi:DNA repair protein RAD50